MHAPTIDLTPITSAIPAKAGIQKVCVNGIAALTGIAVLGAAVGVTELPRPRQPRLRPRPHQRAGGIGGEIVLAGLAVGERGFEQLVGNADRQCNGEGKKRRPRARQARQAAYQTGLHRGDGEEVGVRHVARRHPNQLHRCRQRAAHEQLGHQQRQGEQRGDAQCRQAGRG